ncbi:site-specific integrase [Solimicrobium silvestre]|uniref:Phage integrase family n=1 Tax=Solimicrobium silvestre TaxID=2099400 RepID=A0A2S9GT08_9BURK|nr:site-specific integrase [Solimicrobium silvestre]PRC90854.1 Phage integrase family [Solimicrobium silvestre]
MASIRQKNGAWVVDIRRKGHKSISKSFRTKSLAQTWAREIEQQIDSMQYKDVRSLALVTVRALIDKYIEEIGSIKKIGRTKADSLRKWKITHGALTVSELTDDLLIKHIQQRAKTVSGVTIAVDLAYLSGVLKTAKELWRMPVDMSVTVTARASLRYLGLTSKSRERDRRPTNGEIEDICLHFAIKTRQRVPMGDLIHFAIETAMRAGEIVNLRWQDINHDHKTITIRNRKHPTEKEGNHQEVPLLGTAYDILVRQPKKDKEERIFPIAEGTVSSLFPRACNALGIDDLRFHDLRHEGVSRLFERGLSIMEVSLISGHRDLKMLKRYVNLRAVDISNKYLS